MRVGDSCRTRRGHPPSANDPLQRLDIGLPGEEILVAVADRDCPSVEQVGDFDRQAVLSHAQQPRPFRQAVALAHGLERHVGRHPAELAAYRQRAQCPATIGMVRCRTEQISRRASSGEATAMVRAATRRIPPTCTGRGGGDPVGPGSDPIRY